MNRYEQLAEALARQIRAGVWPPGVRIPGTRDLARLHQASITTVMAAQRLLESWGLVEARPRSGYYVRAQVASEVALPAPGSVDGAPTLVRSQQMALTLIQATARADHIPLGAAVPHADFLPIAPITRALAAAARHAGARGGDYDFPPGCPELRTQIARRMALAGCELGPEGIITTSGAQEALTLALRAVAEPGDVIAIETPTYYGLLQVIEALGMRALEIPTDPLEGIDPVALAEALQRWPVKACVVVSNFSNPLGCVLSDARKRELVALCSHYAVPLVENDIYGELGFSAQRPLAAKHFDQSDNVLYVSSFSKTLEPGLRVGWIAPGRHFARIAHLKYVSSLATPTIPQLAIARYLAQGGYDRVLRSAREAYARHIALMSAAVGRYFPEGTRISRPAGGFVIWLELPERVDTLALYEQALTRRITIAPGPLFSATGRYRHCLRLTCALPWDSGLEEALATLGRLAQGQLDAMR